MEEQQRLVASRRAHKAHLTKLFKKITELKEAEIDQNEKHALVTGLLEQLERKGKILSELNEKVFALITEPEDLETDIMEAEDTQSLIAETICMARNFIKKSENKTSIMSTNTIEQNQAAATESNTQETTGNNLGTLNTESESTVDQPSQETQAESTQSSTVSENLPANLNQPSVISTSSPSTNPTVLNSQYSTSRLPKLALPTFDGNPLSWQSFWDSFRTAVHDNLHLSNIQKLNYLRAQLSGEASRSIAGFPLTDNNYLESIKLLQERFGQQHKAVSAHMQALLNIQSPTSSLQSLKDFYDTLESGNTHPCTRSVREIP